MIKAICRTNFDEGKRRKWPTEFAAVPRVGDYVRDENNYVLKVIRITHFIKTVVHQDDIERIPMIEIELNI
jgi:hypothetical protein